MRAEDFLNSFQVQRTQSASALLDSLAPVGRGMGGFGRQADTPPPFPTANIGAIQQFPGFEDYQPPAAQDPYAMLEQQVARAGQPEQEPAESRDQLISRYRNAWITKYPDLAEFLDQLEADETLDAKAIEREFLYAVGMYKQEQEQQKDFAKQQEKAAKDEERRYEKFLQEQRREQEKAAKEQQREVQRVQQQEQKAVETQVKSQTELQKEQIKAGAKPEAAPSPGILGTAKDVAVNVASGMNAGLQYLSNVFGANNPVSQFFRDNQAYYSELLSASAKEDQAKIAELLKEAEDKGVVENVKAGLKAFAEAPLMTGAQAVGTMVPNVLAGAAGRVLGLGKIAATGIAGTFGAATGAGITKESIYEGVLDGLTNAGVPPEAAAEAAREAQAYLGENWGQIATGAGLGLVDILTGAESILSKALARQGASVPVSRMASLLLTAAKEGGLEAAQGGQEQLAANIAQQRVGLDVPTMRGVAGQAAMEGAAGAVLGGAASLAGTPSQAPAPAIAPTPEPAPAPRPRAEDVLPPRPEPVVDYQSRLKAVGYSDAEASKVIADLRKEGLSDLEIDERIKDIEYGEQQARTAAEQRRTEATELAKRAREDVGARREAIAERATPETQTVTVGDATFNFRDGEWYREGSATPVKSTRLLAKIEEEASRAVQVRETTQVPVREGTETRPQVDEGVRVETPPVEKVEAEVAAPRTEAEVKALPAYSVYETTVGGKQRWAVITKESQGRITGHTLFDSADAANKESARLRVADEARQTRIQEEATRIADAEKAAAESNVGQFTASMSPAQASRATEALSAITMSRGKPTVRRELVEKLVSDGATIRTHPKFGRILENPDGSFIEQSRLTKTAMDYADFLLKKKTPEITLPRRGVEGLIKEEIPATAAEGKPTPAKVPGAEGAPARPETAPDVPTRIEIEDEIRDVPYRDRRKILVERAKQAGVEEPSKMSNDQILDAIDKREEIDITEAVRTGVGVEEAMKRKEQGGFVAGPPALNRVIENARNKIKQKTTALKEGAQARKIRTEKNNELVAANQKYQASFALLNDVTKRAQKSVKDKAGFVRDLGYVLSEPKYEIGGEIYERIDFEKMGFTELDRLLKKQKVYTTTPKDANGKQLSEEALVDLAIQNSKDLTLTPEQLGQKYKLSNEDVAQLKEANTQSLDASRELSGLLEDAGQAVRGSTVAQNVRYTHKTYLKHILGEKFEPKPENVKIAVEDSKFKIRASIERVENELSRINTLAGDKADIVGYMQTGDIALIDKLTPQYKDKMAQLKSVYDALGNAKTFISTQGDKIVVGRSADGIQDAAETLVDDIVRYKPSKQPDVRSGVGNAADALLKRDLQKVYRELFGEVTDPTRMWNVSRNIQAENIGRLASFARLSKMTGLHSDVRDDANGYTIRLGSSQDVGAPVTAYDRQRYGVLAGKWIKQEVADEMRINIGSSDSEPAGVMGNLVKYAGEAARKVVGTMRLTAVTRPAAIVRDEITNVAGFMAAAGDLSPAAVKEFINGKKIITKLITAKATKNAKMEAEARRAFEFAAKKGFYRKGMSSMTAEIETMLGERNVLSRGMNNVGELRSMLADFSTKWAGWHARKEKLTKRYADELKSGKMTVADIEKMATDHVAKVYDNRDEIPAWFGKLADNPLSLDFMRFKYSNTRALINSFVEIAEEAKDAKVSKAEVANRLAQLSLSLGFQGTMSATKWGAGTGIATGLAKFYANTLGGEVEDLEPGDKELEDAVRFMGEYYYANEAMNVHVDKNGKIVRTIWSGGATSPFNILVDLPTGYLDTWDAPVGGKGRRAVENIIGSAPMAYQAVAEQYKNAKNFLEEWTKEKEAEAANIKYDKKSSKVGHEALSDIFTDMLGWYGRVGVAATGYGETRQAERMERMTTKIGPDGTRVPKSDLTPSEFYAPRELQEVVAGGMIPMPTKVYTKENSLDNIFNRAYYLNPTRIGKYRGLLTGKVGEERAAVQETLLEDMLVWKQYAEKILKTTRPNEDINKLLRSTLKSADYSEDQIEYIMQGGKVRMWDISKPKPSGGTGLSGSVTGVIKGGNIGGKVK